MKIGIIKLENHFVAEIIRGEQTDMYSLIFRKFLPVQITADNDRTTYIGYCEDFDIYEGPIHQAPEYQISVAYIGPPVMQIPEGATTFEKLSVEQKFKIEFIKLP